MISEEIWDTIKKEKNIAETFVTDVELWLKKDSRNAVYLYGAGDQMCWVVSFLKKNKIPIKSILDSNKKGEYDSIPIIKYSSFIENVNKVRNHCWFVISAPSVAEKLTSILRKTFLKENITCCDMQLYTEFVKDVEEYRRYLLLNKEKFNMFYDSLSDDYSRKTLECILKGRITGDIHNYRECYSPDDYYPDDIVHFENNTVMVELGGYDGETILEFINKCPNFKTAYCFEPDSKLLPNLYAIRDKQSSYGRKINIISKGAWDKEDILRFAIGNISDDTGTLFLDNGTENYINVEVTTVDNSVDENITYMKMDIEGAELKALYGAEKQIKRNKPTLAVSVYHKQEDIIDIWEYLRSLVPEYRFYIRHHTENVGTDTVMYAVMP